MGSGLVRVRVRIRITRALYDWGSYARHVLSTVLYT